MTIMVTGGAGFIGSHLVDELLRKKHQVFILDNLSTGKKENVNGKARFIKGDIRNASFVLRSFRKVKPAYVFHLAAIPRVPLSVEDPIGTSEANILGTVHVLKAALDTKVKRVVFASSSSVYGNQKKLPLQESMRPSPLSPYGLQKWVGEEWAKIFSTLYGLPVVSLRYFNVYGPRIDFKSDYSLVLGKFLRLQKQKKPFTIFGSGEQTRAFCYIDDVIAANIKAVETKDLKGGEILNIGGNASHSVNYLADLLGGERVYLPPRPGDVQDTKADTSLAKKLLGWQPKTSFEEGVEKTKDWFSHM